MAIKHKFEYLKHTRHGIVKKTETRNLTRGSAIRFHCLDCSGGSTPEVARCIIKTCPLWVFRPYQKRPLKPIEAPDSADNE